MKKAILFTCFSLSFLAMHAQMNWTISYRQKDLLKNAEEDPAKNKVTLTKSSLTGTGSFNIILNNPDTSANITLMADYEGSATLKSWENVTGRVVITIAEMKALLAAKKVIHFYYTAIPKDPELAMRVRVRRVHVCTVLLK